MIDVGEVSFVNRKHCHSDNGYCVTDQMASYYSTLDYYQTLGYVRSKGPHP